MTSIIVWDEVVMANKNKLASLDIAMRDILEEDRFVGGTVFACAGDFRRIVPVTRGGGKSDELEYCIMSSYFWDNLTKLELTENLRLNAKENKTLAKNLLALAPRKCSSV